MIKYSSNLEMFTNIETGDGVEGTALAPYSALERARLDWRQTAGALQTGRERALRRWQARGWSTAAMIVPRWRTG